MTKVIAIAVIVLLLYGGWNFFLYWERVKNEKEEEAQQVAAAVVVPEQLPGLPGYLEPTLRVAEQQGPAALRAWLKTNGPAIQDPRKAWIELDYCVMVVRDDPSEARRVFADVRDRTPPSSPVWPRIKQLQPGYQ